MAPEARRGPQGQWAQTAPLPLARALAPQPEVLTGAR